MALNLSCVDEKSDQVFFEYPQMLMSQAFSRTLGPEATVSTRPLCIDPDY